SPEGKIMDANEAAVKVTGTPKEGLIGTDFSDYFTEPDKARAGYQQVFREGFVKDYELGLRHRDGGIVSVLYNAAVYRDEGGRVIGVFAAARDITERKRVEEALKISDRRFRMAQAIGHLGNWEYDLQTGIFWGSEEARRIYGFDPEAANFSTEEVEQCITERERVHQALVDLIERNKPYDLEFEIHPKGSSERKFISSIAEVRRDEQGMPLLVMGVIHDITARKDAEEAVRRLNEELERRVLERTADLQAKSDELRESQSALMNIVEDLNKKSVALEAANKELESFSYSVSHDLRGPLRSIDGFSRALLDDYNDLLDDEGRENLHTIRAASQKMGRLIDDMLRLSQINRSEMRWTKVDLSRMIEMVIDDLRKAEPGREVDVLIAPGCTATGDAALLRIALENILGNAWKYTSRKPRAKIEFGVTETAEGRTYFLRDDGCGFDMKFVHKLFGAFQRLHTPDEFPGTGIGLASVQRVIRRHGGRVWIEGDVGRGTTVYFTLPKHINPLS
ncbi:MAG TPA: PAS domain S-box protein, partial [Candidatus Paceibacterota bacterium]|nr:PAS domain S-box protein [Candidatus Paceibacterota bacterium]